MTTICPLKKLDHKHFGPFEILLKVGAAAYKLKLPHTWKTVWPIFNKVLLTPYTPLQFETQQHPPPPPVLVNQESKYEVEEIIDSRLL